MINHSFDFAQDGEPVELEGTKDTKNLLFIIEY